MKLFMKYLPITVLLLLTGCSSRPTQDQLSLSIIAASEDNPTSDINTDHADCVAQALLESDLSDTTLDGLAQNFSTAIILGTEQDKLPKILNTASQDCLEKQ